MVLGRETIVKYLVLPLVVLLVGGVLLLQIEFSLFSKNTPDLQAEARQTIEKLEGNKVKSVLPPVIESDLGELQDLLKLADKVFGPSARNAELVKIVALALEEEKPGFAIDAAVKVFGPSARNEQFTIILDKCIEWKKFDLALMAADSLSGPSWRNEGFKKVIDGAIKLRGKKDITMREALQP